MGQEDGQARHQQQTPITAAVVADSQGTPNRALLSGIVLPFDIAGLWQSHSGVNRRMHEHEETFIAAFISKEKQDRYRFLLGSSDPNRRSECLDRLNHCHDFNEKYVTWLPRDPRSTTRNAEIATLLREKGSPKRVYVLACACPADGQMLPLLDAMDQTTASGWGTIISCIPGQLVYYFDEEGERRAILERKPGK